MNINGLDGKQHRWNPHLKAHPKESCSKHHELARRLLKELYPMDIIHEEVTLPGSNARGHDLRADFYIHAYRLMVEVQGEQHYTCNSHFFDTTLDFRRAKLRDKQKQEWCDANGITLITLPYSESVDEWRKRITNRD
jgi:hypothetical protein